MESCGEQADSVMNLSSSISKKDLSRLPCPRSHPQVDGTVASLAERDRHHKDMM